MFNYYYRQNPIPATPMATPSAPMSMPTAPMATPSAPMAMPTMFPTNQEQATTSTMQPYQKLQGTTADIRELYHQELINLNNYRRLLQLSSGMENEEILESIIDTTTNNLMYLRQIFLGLTGNTLDEVDIRPETSKELGYNELLKVALLSKLDTLDNYQLLYTNIPIVPYKDILFETIVRQLKDSSFLNYLLSAV